MSSDHASIPTRGSRLVGLLSMIITSVLGSGAWEQERRGSKHPLTNATKIVILSGAKDLLLACARTAALGIRDFPQDRRPLRSRSRRHIAGPSLPRLMREQGKRHRLLRFRGKSEFIGEMQFDSQRRDCVAQHGHQCWILCASAGDYHLATSLSSACCCSWNNESRQHEALDRVRNRSRRQGRCRGHYVRLTGAAADLKKSADVFATEFLAARRSRRLLPEEGSSHQFFNHAIQHAS